MCSEFEEMMAGLKMFAPGILAQGLRKGPVAANWAGFPLTPALSPSEGAREKSLGKCYPGFRSETRSTLGYYLPALRAFGRAFQTARQLLNHSNKEKS